MKRPRHAGFTLLEVLVALMISGLVMTSVLASLDYTQRAVDAIHNVIETESAGPRVMALIREDLSRLAVYDADEFTLFRGQNESIRGMDADWMDFIEYRQSSRPLLDFRSGQMLRAPVNEVGYRLRLSPRSSDFLELYRREDILSDEDPFEGGTFTLLYDRVTNFDVVYYKRPEQDPSWEEEWDTHELQALPYALEVNLELEIQPRSSAESLDILGANRARLEFKDLVTIPEETRWVFRQRLRPVIPAKPEGAAGAEGAGGPGKRPDGESGLDAGAGTSPSSGETITGQGGG